MIDNNVKEQTDTIKSNIESANLRWKDLEILIEINKQKINQNNFHLPKESVICLSTQHS